MVKQLTDAIGGWFSKHWVSIVSALCTAIVAAVTTAATMSYQLGTDRTNAFNRIDRNGEHIEANSARITKVESGFASHQREQAQQTQEIQVQLARIDEGVKAIRREVEKKP